MEANRPLYKYVLKQIDQVKGDHGIPDPTLNENTNCCDPSLGRESDPKD